MDGLIYGGGLNLYLNPESDHFSVGARLSVSHFSNERHSEYTLQSGTLVNTSETIKKRLIDAGVILKWELGKA